MAKVRTTKTVNPFLRGVSYSRVSDDAQYLNEDGTERKDASPEAQRKRCDEHVSFLNRKQEGKVKYELIDHLVDKGLSGKNTKRPAFQKMCGMIESEQVDFVICTELSRLSRSVVDFLAFVKLCEEHDVRIIVIGLDLDTSTAYGRFVVIILIALAQFEREMTSTRVKENSLIRLLKDGKINGAGEILGLIRDAENPGHFLVDEAGLRTAEKVLKLFLKFSSKEKVLRAAKEAGLTDHKGKELTKNIITNVLFNVRWRYRGRWAANWENEGANQDALPEKDRFQLVPLPHKQLLPNELLDEVEAKHKATIEKWNRSGKDDYVYLLSGILFAEDGSKFHGMIGHGNGGDYRYYRSPKLNVRIRCDELDAFIVKWLKGYLSDNEAFARLAKKAIEQREYRLIQLDEDRKRLNDEIAELDKRSKGLEERVLGMLEGDNRDTVGKWLAGQIKEIEQLKAAKTRSLDDLNSARDDIIRQSGLSNLLDTVQDLINSFEKFTPIERKTLVQQVVERIIIRKLNKIDLVLYAEPPSPSKFITGGGNSRIREKLVGQTGRDSLLFPPPDPRFLTVDDSSTFSFLPLHRDPSFLHQKYAVEGLSPEQITALCFSSTKGYGRKRVVSGLREFGIPLRAEDERPSGPLPFGWTIKGKRLQPIKTEQTVIHKMKALRAKGMSYEKIADVLNALSFRTRSGKAPWYGNSVYRVMLRTAHFRRHDG